MACYEEAFKVKEELENKKKIYVAFSGGKDSTAMLLRLIELGEHIDEIVFADTGFEFPELYEYIDKIEKHIGRPITRLKLPEGTWNKWFYGGMTRGKYKGKPRGFPMRLFPCYWTREAKVKQLEKKYADSRIVNVGIAFDEQKRMSKDEYIRYPLIEWGWTELDCANYLKKKGLHLSLYDKFNRLGCYFCQKQNDSALWHLWKHYPDLWENAKYWDKESRKISQTGHGIKEKPLEEYEKEFEKGFKPKEPKYKNKCDIGGCDGVGSAFNLRQAKLDNFIKKNKRK